MGEPRWRINYTPGPWTVLAGPTSLVALDPDAPGALTSELWEVVDAEVDTAGLVARLARIDATRLPGLAVLVFEETGIRALLRGDIGVRSTAGETVAHGADVLTWQEVRLAGLREFELDLGGPDEPDGLPIVRGAVRAGRLRLVALGSSPTAPAAESPAGDPLPAGPPPAAPPEPPAARPEPETEPDFKPDSEPDLEPDLGDDGGFETQVVPPPEPYAAGEGPPTTADPRLIPAVSSAQDIEVMENADTELMYLPPPAIARLRAPDGSTVDLDRPVLIGRAPSDAGFENAQPHLLTVPSPSQDISRTHLLVAPEGGAIVVTDLHSTNGTTVIKPGPQTERVTLPSGQPVSVQTGSMLELGDEVAILIDDPH